MNIVPGASILVFLLAHMHWTIYDASNWWSSESPGWRPIYKQRLRSIKLHFEIQTGRTRHELKRGHKRQGGCSDRTPRIRHCTRKEWGNICPNRGRVLAWLKRNQFLTGYSAKLLLLLEALKAWQIHLQGLTIHDTHEFMPDRLSLSDE